MKQLPWILNCSFFEYETVLDNKPYHLTFRWNERMSVWIMDIADMSRKSIISGITVGMLRPLLSDFGRDTLPPGDIVLVPTGEGFAITPAVDNVGEGKAFLLWYVEQSERSW